MKDDNCRGIPMCMQIRMRGYAVSIGFSVTAKPVLSGLSKIDKKRCYYDKINGSLMKVESQNSECCFWIILQYF